MKYLSLLFFFIPILITSSCKPSGSEEKTIEAAPATKFKLTPFASSTEFMDAEITSMSYSNGVFDFGVGGDTYKLGVQTPDAPQKMCANSVQGQHIHLIDGPRPYAAKYVSNFEHELEDGNHYLLAFLSRSYHESIKTDKAFVAKKVNIENKSISNEEDIADPMIFYSRPKGTYVGDDTKRVMLDFYLVNCNIGESYFVKAEINGEVHMIDSWQPYYIDGLPMGENTIKLTLLDEEDNPVAAPHNPVQRTFTLKADPEM